ncbi:hypothetical protein NKH93_24920 [Mesorhizobium sp. M0954]|uniref:hypothetical protein n=2 Tax=unclassified Mesorhizobium TaxID=325217 RepID=UPI00333AE941
MPIASGKQEGFPARFSERQACSPTQASAMNHGSCVAGLSREHPPNSDRRGTLWRGPRRRAGRAEDDQARRAFSAEPFRVLPRAPDGCQSPELSDFRTAEFTNLFGFQDPRIMPDWPDPKAIAVCRICPILGVMIAHG